VGEKKMRTLDEVIKVMNVCDETQRLICIECPYVVDCKDVPGKKLRADALYYLQKYQEHYKARNNQVEKYQKTAHQCEDKPVWIDAESLPVGMSPYWKDLYIIKSFSNDEFMYCNDDSKSEGESMTLEEAIKHCNEIAEDRCDECGMEHHQLAEWLKELQVYRKEQNE
jgi:hypothetical protein